MQVVRLDRSRRDQRGDGGSARAREREENAVNEEELDARYDALLAQLAALGAEADLEATARDILVAAEELGVNPPPHRVVLCEDGEVSVWFRNGPRVAEVDTASSLLLVTMLEGEDIDIWEFHPTPQEIREALVVVQEHLAKTEEMAQ
jgi:hypothetical protein